MEGLFTQRFFGRINGNSLSRNQARAILISVSGLWIELCTSFACGLRLLSAWT